MIAWKGFRVCLLRKKRFGHLEAWKLGVVVWKLGAKVCFSWVYVIRLVMIGESMEIMSRMTYGCVMNIIVLMVNGNDMRNLNGMLDNCSLCLSFGD